MGGSLGYQNNIHVEAEKEKAILEYGKKLIIINYEKNKEDYGYGIYVVTRIGSEICNLIDSDEYDFSYISKMVDGAKKKGMSVTLAEIFSRNANGVQYGNEVIL